MTILRVSLVFLLLAAGLAMAQEKRPPSPEDKKFGEALTAARQFASQKKYDDALRKLDEAEALKPGNAIVYNARGSIYTTIKDYDRAREAFVKADSLKPGAFEARHNLTELDFVQGKYEAAGDAFAAMLATFNNLPVQVRSLVQFKVIVCKLKLDKISEAEALAKNYAFPEESPPGYFSKATIALQKGDTANANAWLDKAQKNFKPVEILPYLDALAEARWISMPAAAPAPANTKK